MVIIHGYRRDWNCYVYFTIGVVMEIPITCLKCCYREKSVDTCRWVIAINAYYMRWCDLTLSGKAHYCHLATWVAGNKGAIYRSWYATHQGWSVRKSSNRTLIFAYVPETMIENLLWESDLKKSFCFVTFIGAKISNGWCLPYRINYWNMNT